MRKRQSDGIMHFYLLLIIVLANWLFHDARRKTDKARRNNGWLCLDLVTFACLFHIVFDDLQMMGRFCFASASNG
jgi:hypothetical protein